MYFSTFVYVLSKACLCPLSTRLNLAYLPTKRIDWFSSCYSIRLLLKQVIVFNLKTFGLQNLKLSGIDVQLCVKTHETSVNIMNRQYWSFGPTAVFCQKPIARKCQSLSFGSWPISLRYYLNLEYTSLQIMGNQIGPMTATEYPHEGLKQNAKSRAERNDATFFPRKNLSVALPKNRRYIKQMGLTKRFRRILLPHSPTTQLQIVWFCNVTSCHSIA